MRKSIKISGVVAGLGLALMPIATFADGPTRTDHLNVTIDEACTINGSALDQAANIENTYDANITPNEAPIAFTRRTSGDGGAAQESKFSITCNYNDGYRITARSGALILSGADAENPAADERIPAHVASQGQTGWYLTMVADHDLVAVSGNIAVDGTVMVANTTKATETATFTPTYYVAASTDVKAGAYSGDVVYTLVQGATGN